MAEMNDLNQHRISDVLSMVLKKYHLHDKLEEIRLYEAWEEVMGKTVAQCTESIRLKNGILSISLNSPALRTELTMARTRIILRLNAMMGKELVKDIRIR
jgi:hypothetical protein